MRISTWSAKPLVVGLLSVAVFLLVWKAASLLMGSSVILPSPEETIGDAALLVGRTEFWKSLGSTVLRGVLGFSVSLAAGVLVGFPAGRYPLFRLFVKPYLTAIQSTPVLAVILVALIWFRTEIVPVFVAFLMAFPVIVAAVIEGMRSLDPKLLDMAKVYRVGKRRLLFGLFLPSVLPFLAAGASAALGLSWRVVVAAEVLSQPLWGIGTGLQEAKIRLDTPRVFAWTLTALVVSFVMDRLFSRLVKRLREGTSS